MITLVLSCGSGTAQAFASVVRRNRDAPGVCVLLGPSALGLKEFLGKDRQDTVVIAVQRGGKHALPANPRDLTALSVMVQEALQMLPPRKVYLAIDSFEALEQYNRPDTVLRFAHFLLKRVHAWGIDAHITCTEERASAGLLSFLKQGADAVVRPCA
jgi:hypothetical protein